MSYTFDLTENGREYTIELQGLKTNFGQNIGNDYIAGKRLQIQNIALGIIRTLNATDPQVLTQKVQLKLSGKNNDSGEIIAPNSTLNHSNLKEITVDKQDISDIYNNPDQYRVKELSKLDQDYEPSAALYNLRDLLRILQCCTQIIVIAKRRLSSTN